MDHHLVVENMRVLGGVGVEKGGEKHKLGFGDGGEGLSDWLTGSLTGSTYDPWRTIFERIWVLFVTIDEQVEAESFCIPNQCLLTNQ